MADPTTTNTGLAIPLRGSDVGTWDTPVNGDFSALDGYLGGVQIISAASSPITLTSPSGFTPTPSGGPTQAQNAILRVTGTLTAPVQITLPLPGPIVIENLTTGAFVLSFRAVGAGQVIAVNQGKIQTIYNDGTNVRFVNLGGDIGETSIWAGRSAMPAWVTACTVPPYLLCDGTIYNFTAYPYLGAILGSSFGGNGVTTFGVPDLRGRMTLPYDGTGTRITTAGSGLNGQTLGAALDKQTNTLITVNLPPYTPSVSSLVVTFPSNVSGNPPNVIAPGGSPVGFGGAATGATPFNIAGLAMNTSIVINPQGGTSTPVNNVQPSQVTGIAVIRAA